MTADLTCRQQGHHDKPIAVETRIAVAVPTRFMHGVSALLVPCVKKQRIIHYPETIHLIDIAGIDIVRIVRQLDLLADGHDLLIFFQLIFLRKVAGIATLGSHEQLLVRAGGDYRAA
jgi:hypothetical protein